MVALSPVPEISISLAPPEEPFAEPFSPFSSCGPTTPDDSDGFRSSLLSPPLSVSPRFPRLPSPLRPFDASIRGQGIERERFEELLRASRERNAVAMSGKKSPDLRKEIAIKVHKNKQLERRALFLSKIHAPPSPTAVLLPKTPPESPAIFHYSLPSPGLQSPLAVFETLASEDPSRPPRKTWVEQVEFRLPGQLSSKPSLRSAPVLSRSHLPSLDQITAHLSSQCHIVTQRREKTRLPAFLRSRTSQEGTARAAASATEARPTLPADVGRLRFPVRSPTPPSPELPRVEVASEGVLPPSPCSPKPRLEITTTVVPCTSSKSPVALTANNLRVLSDARERKAQDMLKRLRRRTLPPAALGELMNALGTGTGKAESDNRKLRRHSAPPELVTRDRVGFMTPKLDLPGAF